MNEAHMKRAVALSRRGMELGHGGPFGAVVVRDDTVIGEGWNEVLLSKDPTAHAEIVAIRHACRKLATHDLSGCEIYASCEPCPMCLGAIYWSR
ncbi:MAG: nucleoside deaminase, partial [Bryobacterales bacterium]|nr:nucleoside deaminase [Bryobacterales bacterium]